MSDVSIVVEPKKSPLDDFEQEFNSFFYELLGMDENSDEFVKTENNTVKTGETAKQDKPQGKAKKEPSKPAKKEKEVIPEKTEEEDKNDE